MRGIYLKAINFCEDLFSRSQKSAIREDLFSRISHCEIFHEALFSRTGHISDHYAIKKEKKEKKII